MKVNNLFFNNCDNNEFSAVKKLSPLRSEPRCALLPSVVGSANRHADVKLNKFEVLKDRGGDSTEKYLNKCFITCVNGD
ncbi:hypothetical protein COV20_06115 [Candidatus Woesearchaeota archaeon CG10_big_fil_rev_8_21_14_0_10_45_16]|nr:MAG: hypothetical protein COV20_06115 [Candidatus Woesearchaeota archaeon CG10_big_fil_rev_8_21_14_0_10_45_16]